MAKKIHIVCNNVFKNNNKKTFKEELNKKMIKVIEQSESNKEYAGKIG